MERLIAEPSAEDIVQALLEETGNTSPPTDPMTMAGYLNLRVEGYDDDNQFGLVNSRINAFLWPSKRIIGVHKKLKPKQRRFSILHEIGHFVLPGHLQSREHDEKVEDGRDNLSPWAQNILEREANQFAADCLFQLDGLEKVLRASDLSWGNIVRASELFDASIEATSRRWVERTETECGLVVFNPLDRGRPGSALGVMYTIVSRSFKQRNFAQIQPGQQFDTRSPIYRYFYGQEYLGDTPRITISVQKGTEDYGEFSMELFSNSYRLFGLLTPSN
ncbi:MAG: ImmA/IrrE family metallo-endopeptidase [Anaerolineae bacterium]|nr:ImmA/IrrE family metallo-endopeptidase [Anaerolineae bacterium]